MIKKIEFISDIFSYPQEETLKKFEISLSLTETESEYVSLFVNSFDKIKCSPYAYDYFNNINPSDFFIKLRELYKSAGLEISEDYNEREDHIVTLIEFLGYLIQINTPEGYIKKFIKNYLFWIPEFVKKIKSSTKHPLYLYGAELLGEIYEYYENN